MKTIKNLTAEQLRKAILQLAIQGKLVKQDPNDEPSSELVKRIHEEKQHLIQEGRVKRDKVESFIFLGDDNRYYEKIESYEPTELEGLPFELPHGWCWIRQSNICWLDNGEKTREGRLPYLEAKVIRNNLPDSYLEEGVVVDRSDKLILVDGENSGEVFVPSFKGYMGSTFKLLRVTPLISFDFLLLVFELNRNLYKNNKSGAAIPHLNRRLLREFLVALPPLNEQKRIVRKVHEFDELLLRYKGFESKISELENRFESRLRSSILQYAVEGKLVKQDPDDEPASVLLGRIAEEKERLIREGKIKPRKHETSPALTEDKDCCRKLHITLPLKSVCSYGSTVLPHFPRGNQYRLIELDQIKSGDSSCPPGIMLNEHDSPGGRITFKKGMILYSKLRPYLDKVVLANKDGYCSSELVPFWSYISPGYLLLYLHSPKFISSINGSSYGVKMPRAKTSVLLSSQVNVFGENTTERIVERVSALFRIIS